MSDLIDVERTSNASASKQVNRNRNMNSRVQRNKQRKRKSNRRRGRRVDDRQSKYVLAQINPFSDYVDGVRIPDEYGYPTGTNILRAAFTFTNGGTYVTGGVAAFLPWIDAYVYAPASVTAGGVATWFGGATTALPQSAAMNSTYSSMRPVSWGIRITTDQALTTASGHVWIAHVPIDLDSDQYGWSYWPDREQGVAALPLAEKYPISELASKPLIVTGRRVDDSSYRFRDLQYPQNASPYAETNTGWCAIIVYTSGCAGGASASVLNVEYVLHTEALHRGNQGTALSPDTAVIPANPAELVLAQHVNSFQEVAHVEPETANGWFDKIDDVVNRVANSAANIVGKGVGAYALYSRMTAPRTYGRPTAFLEY